MSAIDREPHLHAASSLARVGIRLLAVAAIFAGAVVVGFYPNRWDVVILELPRESHGVHLHDVIGMTLISLGVLGL